MFYFTCNHGLSPTVQLGDQANAVSSCPQRVQTSVAAKRILVYFRVKKQQISRHKTHAGLYSTKRTLTLQDRKKDNLTCLSIMLGYNFCYQKKFLGSEVRIPQSPPVYDSVHSFNSTVPISSISFRPSGLAHIVKSRQICWISKSRLWNSGRADASLTV